MEGVCLQVYLLPNSGRLLCVWWINLHQLQVWKSQEVKCTSSRTTNSNWGGGGGLILAQIFNPTCIPFIYTRWALLPRVLPFPLVLPPKASCPTASFVSGRIGYARRC